MGRLNLTLDEDTFRGLKKHASSQSKPAARIARDLIREGLARREATERLRRLARDYAMGRKDSRALLNDLESGQLDLLEDDET